MELLTGKAKEDFNEWVRKEMFHFGFDYNQDPIKINNLSESFLNSIIIDWLDSIQIVVVIESLAKNFFSFQINSKKWIDSECAYKTRQEATTEAIKTAIEIYNKKND